MGWYNSDYPPYVSVAERRAKAARAAAKLNAKGEALTPLVVEGRTFGRTFWGRAWCDHIEGLSDFASRLPKGKTYARNGSVINLKVSAGRIDALVMGSELYTVKVTVKLLEAATWAGIQRRSAGQIESLVELLQGKMSDAVMRVVTDPAGGLFPTAADMTMRCSCPDPARLCKHLAAVLYGVGVRLDDQPELLFRLRGVDQADLIAAAVTGGVNVADDGATRNTLGDHELADVFGIEVTPVAAPTPPAAPPAVVKATAVRARAGKRAAKPAVRAKRKAPAE